MTKTYQEHGQESREQRECQKAERHMNKALFLRCTCRRLPDDTSLLELAGELEDLAKDTYQAGREGYKDLYRKDFLTNCEWGIGPLRNAARIVGITENMLKKHCQPPTKFSDEKREIIDLAIQQHSCQFPSEPEIHTAGVMAFTNLVRVACLCPRRNWRKTLREDLLPPFRPLDHQVFTVAAWGIQQSEWRRVCIAGNTGQGREELPDLAELYQKFQTRWPDLAKLFHDSFQVAAVVNEWGPAVLYAFTVLDELLGRNGGSA